MKAISKFIGFGALAGIAITNLGPAALAQFGLTSADSKKFAVHDSASNQAIDFGVLDSLLEAFVIEQKATTIVRYGVIKGEGQKLIEDIVTGFEQIDIKRLNRDQQLAYWLNLRMLMVLHSTSSAYPAVKPKSLLASNSAYLNTPLVTVQDIELSIADVDKIILDNWADTPSVVFGLVVPTKGGPSFPRKSYDGKTVNAELETMARQFINRPGIVKPSRSTAKISSFLIWHKAHLGGTDQAILKHVHRLADPKLTEKLASVQTLEEKFDWKLNDFRERSFAQNRGNEFSRGGISGGSGFDGRGLGGGS